MECFGGEFMNQLFININGSCSPRMSISRFVLNVETNQITYIFSIQIN